MEHSEVHNGGYIIIHNTVHNTVHHEVHNKLHNTEHNKVHTTVHQRLHTTVHQKHQQEASVHPRTQRIPKVKHLKARDGPRDRSHDRT